MTHVHLIGIGGTGLSAIARVLLERGIRVSGSDRLLSPLAAELQRAGARIFVDHEPEYIAGADLVVRSSAIPDSNVEVKAALAAGIPVMKRRDFLGYLTHGYRIIAIAGTHGKTTTTSMIAWVLQEAGLDPTYIIGSVAANLGGNAHAGTGECFVIEADEYDHMFLGLAPFIAVVTNIEHDHPDCFPTPEDFFLAFEDFAAKLVPDGQLVVCLDDPGAARLAALMQSRGKEVLGYALGESPNFDDQIYRGRVLQANAHGGFDFEFVPPGEASPLVVSLQVPGIHNVSNAVAALTVASLLGIPLEKAAQSLERFRSSTRRFEVRGEAGGVLVIDDYAHHPTEIRATLSAARARYSGRQIWALWQPHTYSRTRSLQSGFAHAFGDADHVLVTAIYAAREEPPSNGFSAAQVVADMDHPDAQYFAILDQAIENLLARLEPGSVVLTLSAGDADRASTSLLQALQQRERLNS